MTWMERISKCRLRRTGLLFAASVAVLSGVGIARLGHPIDSGWWLASGLGLAVSLRWHSKGALLWVLVLGLCLGWWRGSVYMAQVAGYQPLYLQKITIVAQADDDAVYDGHAQLSFDAGRIRLQDGTSLPGKVELSGFGLRAVYQGDTILATGKLYPAFGANQGRMSFARLVLVERHPTLIANLRQRFAAGLQSSLPEPLAPFAMGLLIGQRATLPATVKQDLLMVGLTHIIAVSGYNLTIMLNAGRHLFGRCSKRLSTALCLGLMALFVVLAGSSASIVRAAIVSLLSISTHYYGRRVKPLNLLAMTAAITAWVNPLYLWSDTSWYLSFLAFFGVLLIAPLLACRLRPPWRAMLPVTVGLESLCAEVMTLPFVLHTFGQLSFVGLFANVAVAMFVPLAMLFSLIAGLCGMLLSPVAGWLAWPARWLLTYMLNTAHLLAHLPHVFAQHLSLSLSQMIGYYACLLVLTVVLTSKTKQTGYVKITDKSQEY